MPEKLLFPFILMDHDRIYRSLVAKMQEMAVVPPQRLGLLTPFYKKVVPVFKTSPLKSLLFLSVAATFSAFILFGSRLVKLASILQAGAFHP